MTRDPRPDSWTLIGVLIAVIAIPTTIAVAAMVPGITIAGALLLLLLEVVVVALLSNLIVALATAVGAVAGANYFLTEPFHTFVIADPSDIIALTVFIVTAVVASVLVVWVLRQRETAARSQAETATYRTLLTSPVSENSPEPALRTIVDLLNLYEVELRNPANQRVASVSAAHYHEPKELADVTMLDEELADGYRLLGTGPVVSSADVRLARSLGAAAVRSQQRKELVPGGGGPSGS